MAIKEALDHLADVARTGLARDPDRDALEKKLTAIMEIKEYPGKGNVGEWEAKTALLVYGDSDDEPVDGWERVMGELFEFARENLYCGFSKERNVTAYNRAREALASVGLTAKPVAEIALGKLCASRRDACLIRT